MGPTKEQVLKMHFVENELTEALIGATYGYVRRCEYLVDGPDEYVIVTTNRDGGPTLNVNVTADSHWAILKDVMKAVAKRYE